VVDIEADIDAVMRQSFTRFRKHIVASISTAFLRMDACNTFVPFRERSERFKYALSAGGWGVRRNRKPYTPLALLSARVGERDGRESPDCPQLIVAIRWKCRLDVVCVRRSSYSSAGLVYCGNGRTSTRRVPDVVWRPQTHRVDISAAVDISSLCVLLANELPYDLPPVLSDVPVAISQCVCPLGPPPPPAGAPPPPTPLITLTHKKL
jgi:hypothetical protein